MAFFAQKLPLGAQLPPSCYSHRHRPASAPVSAADASAPVSAAHHPECVLSAKNLSPKSPTNSTRKKTLVLISSSALAAGGFLLHLSTPVPPPGNTGGGGGGGGGGWGWGGFSGGDGGGFWSRIFSPLAAIAKEEDPTAGGGPEWDPHGLPANIIVQLSKLSGFKQYKISEILFFDRRRSTTVAGTEDSFFEMVSLRPGGVYTKVQLQKELETLASCGMFEKVDLEGKTKPDGTLALTVSFVESTWQSADTFRCINVGLMPQTKQMEMDPDMTDREKLEYFRNQEKDYKKRIERSRPCLMPKPVQREVMQMLREHGRVSARLLQRIRDRVQKWYHDEGYACAQVVNFGNLNTREVVCEVVEGDITQLVIQFQDKLGNVCEGNTQLAVVRRELPKQVNFFLP